MELTIENGVFKCSKSKDPEKEKEWLEMVERSKKAKHVTIVNQHGKNSFHISHVENLVIDLK